MHSGRTDNIACGEHQQHACQQRTHPLTLPRLAPQPPLSLWQSRACAGSDIGTGQTSKCAPQSRPDGQGRMRRRGWAHLVGGGRPDTPRCHRPCLMLRSLPAPATRVYVTVRALLGKGMQLLRKNMRRSPADVLLHLRQSEKKFVCRERYTQLRKGGGQSLSSIVASS